MEGNYIEHENEKFLKIKSLDYVQSHQQDLLVGSKFAKITARKGKVGEKVTTIMKDGFTETVNIVTYDSVTGEPDWVVTQASGEQMVVNDTKYKSLYETQNVQEGETIAPSGKYRPMIRLKENVALKTSWGEIQYIKAGGVLVVMGENDIYGIQEQEFNNSYNIIENADAKSLFDANLAVKTTSRMPQIFLSVAYPYENKENQHFMKQVIKYVNSKGLKAVNIRKIEENNIDLVKEINKCLRESEGILSLAFNKGGNKTSPFIQIESALASSLNLPNLMIVPKNVEREGVLYDDNNHGNIFDINNEKDLFAQENKELLSAIDAFVEDIIDRYKHKIQDKDLARFKRGLINENTSAQTKKQVVSFLKNFFSVNSVNTDFEFKNLFIKRPIQIKATVIKKSGFYETKDGKVYLNAGDFLINDIHGKVYSVGEKEFNARYVKMNGVEDTYVTKLIPTVAKKVGDKIQVYSLIDPDDRYEVPRDEFILKYKTMNEHILSLEDEKESSIVSSL